MNSSDREEFVRVLNGLAAIKRVDLTKEAIELWWQSLKDWPVDDFRDAAGYLLKNCQFMPAPYDFEQLRKGSEISSCEAWSLAIEHTKGPWRQRVLGEARIDRAVESLGGYSSIALSNIDKLGFLERRFRDVYDDFLSKDTIRQSLPDMTDTKLLKDVSPATTEEV